MTDAQLRRVGGNVFVADLDTIEGYSASFEARTLRQRSVLAQPGTWDEQIAPRSGASERGTLSIVFTETTSAGTPAVRAYAAYQSLFTGVAHAITNVSALADVPALVVAPLRFTGSASLEQHAEDRSIWRLLIEWERVHA